MRRADTFEKTLMLGKIEGRRRREQQRMRRWDGSLTRWTWVWVSSGSWWWTRKPGMLQAMGSQRAGHNWATELSTTVHSHQQKFTEGLVALQYHQYLLLPDFNYYHPQGFQWYLIVSWICISLKTNEVRNISYAYQTFHFFFSIVPVQDLAHSSVVSIFPIDLEQWFKYSIL